jgi:hypothetical protein
MGGGHQRDLLPLGVATLNPLELRPHGRRSALRLPGRLGHPLPDHGRACARAVAKSMLVAGLILVRDQSERGANRFGSAKPVRVTHEGGRRLSRTNAHSGEAPQLGDRSRWLRLVIQLLLNASGPGG